MGLFSNRISRGELKAGDHIYSWRAAYTYAHHGIYVGNNKVTHFTPRGGQEVGTGISVIDRLLASSVPANEYCSTCKRYMQQGNDRVICCCLDCFLAGGALYRFEYGVNAALFLAKVRGGTCTIAEADPPEEVLHRASYLLENGFGDYNIFKNNCEDFAIYCKTGLIVIEDNWVGRSGQAAAVVGAFDAAYSCSSLGFVRRNTLGLRAAAGLGLYTIGRYVADIGVRKDVAKIPVHSLIMLAENLQH
eukprot:Gb_40392 [translate_table: standard]